MNLLFAVIIAVAVLGGGLLVLDRGLEWLSERLADFDRWRWRRARRR